MKTTNSIILRLLMGLVLCSCIFVFPQQAKADVFETVMLAARAAMPGVGLPSSDELKGMIQLFDEVSHASSAADVEKMVVDYKDKNLPGSDNPWLRLCVNVYVAVQNSDVIGIIEAFADMPIDKLACVIADIVAPGVGGTACEIGELVLKLFSGTIGAAFDAIGDAFQAIFDGFADVLAAMMSSL